MLSLSSLLIFAVALLSAAHASPYAELLKAVEASPEATLKLTARHFKSFIDTGPKNYSLVVELTSIGNSFPCAQCRGVHDEVNFAAESFYESVGGVGSSAFAKNAIFFVYMSYSEAMAEYFRQFQIQSVPYFVFLPASADLGLKLPANSGSGDVSSAEQLQQLVSKKLKTAAFPIRRPITPLIIRYGALTALLYVLVRFVLPALWRNPFNPMLAFVVAMGVFFLSMAGLVFNLIRSPPWAGAKADGSTEFVQGGSRSQYVVEGIIVASLMLVIAVCHIALNEIGAARLSAAKSRIAFYVSFAAYIFALNIVWRIFCVKYGFYPYNVWFNPEPLASLLPF